MIKYDKVITTPEAMKFPHALYKELAFMWTYVSMLSRQRVPSDYGVRSLPDYKLV